MEKEDIPSADSYFSHPRRIFYTIKRCPHHITPQNSPSPPCHRRFQRQRDKKTLPALLQNRQGSGNLRELGYNYTMHQRVHDYIISVEFFAAPCCLDFCALGHALCLIALIERIAALRAEFRRVRRGEVFPRPAGRGMGGPRLLPPPHRRHPELYPAGTLLRGGNGDAA